MITLREKAHASLQAFKDGKESPLTRPVALSDGDVSMEDDELTLLGGKTRLVGRGSTAPTRAPTPTTVQQSPAANQLLFPFPLEQGMDEHMHSTVLDYTNAFVPLPPLTQSPTAINLNFPTNMHIPSPSPEAAAFFDINASYPSPPISSADSSAIHTPRSFSLPDDTLDASIFQSCFPGLEYGSTTSVGALGSPIHLVPQISEEQSMQNAAPKTEMAMQNSWQDLIAQFGLY
jgi:hypothetical protein